MKKIFFLIVLILFLNPAFARNPVNITGRVAHDVSVYNDMPDTIEFIIDKPINISYVEIPVYSNVKAQVYQFYKEQRWHKAGFIVCKVLGYEHLGENYDLSDRNLYLYLRMHEPTDKKEIAITATELTVMTGASLFAPGVDVGYFFIKGAIMRKMHPNWFLAGVSSAYDNSIFWFIEKGKPLKLAAGEEIKIYYMPEEKARKVEAKYGYKKFKKSFKQEKRLVRAEVKEILKEEKAERKNTSTELDVKAEIVRAQEKEEVAPSAGAAKIKDAE